MAADFVTPPRGYRERVYRFLNEEEVAARLDRSNPESPLHGYLGNDTAVEQIADILFPGFHSKSLVAPDRSNRCIGPGGLLLLGPPSADKKELAGRTAMVIELPFVECNRSVRDTGDLLDTMSDTLDAWGVPLVSYNPGGAVLKGLAPPCIVFFGETQAIRGDWLLRATEPGDPRLVTNQWVVNCRNVFWILCTTRRGRLWRDFSGRFRQIVLET